MLSKCHKSWGLCAATATSHISLMTQSHKHALNSQSPEVLTRHQVARYFCLVWRSQCTCGVCFPKLLHAYLYLHTFLDYRGLHLDSWATIFVHIFDFPLEGIGEKRGENSFPVHLMTWSWLHSEQKTRFQLLFGQIIDQNDFKGMRRSMFWLFPYQLTWVLQVHEFSWTWKKHGNICSWYIAKFKKNTWPCDFQHFWVSCEH